MIDAGPARWFALLLGVGLGCQRSRTEGMSYDAAPVPSPSLTARDRDAGSTTRVVHAIAPALSALRPSEPVGGRWVSCYANYRANGAPERDVARLAAMCGPENGMVPVGPIAAGDAVDAAEDHHLDARAGDCFRIFAVADAFVSDLGVEVISPRGNAVTWDRNGDRWPVLNPDGPFCLFDVGTYTVRVRALQGKGRYAMQVWRLP